MFGYIRPLRRYSENYLFRAQYCGLCKYFGTKYGQFSRFFLSYDITFLALMISALSEEPFEWQYEHCVAHWFSKRRIKHPTSVEEAVSDVFVVLLGYKLRDEIIDSEGIRSFFAKRIHNYQLKWKGDFSKELEKKLKSSFEELMEIEMNKTPDPDSASNLFGSIMKTLTGEVLMRLELVVDEDFLKFSELLGKWIYLMDAFEDLEKDIKKWHYNPLIFSNKELLLEEDDNAVIVKQITELEKWRLHLVVDHMREYYDRFFKRLGHFSIEINGIIHEAIPVMTDKVLGNSCKSDGNAEKDG